MHVVRSVDLSLHVEEADRMAKMCAQRRGKIVQRSDHARKHSAPGARNRLLGVDHVEGDVAVVGVDHGLDWVAQVVAHPREVLRVGESIGNGVAVEYPEQAPLVDDHVRVRVKSEKGRHLSDALGDVSVDQHPGVSGEVVGEQHLEIERECGDQQPPPQALERDSTFAIIGGEDVLVALGIIELLLAGIDEDVVCRHLTEVDLRTAHLELRRSGARRQILHVEDWQSLLVHTIHRTDRETVAVREGEALVHPGAAR